MSDEREEWRPIVGFRGYEISSLGRVRSRLTTQGTMRNEPRIITTRTVKKGVQWIALTNRYGRVTREVSALVADAFGTSVQP